MCNGYSQFMIGTFIGVAEGCPSAARHRNAEEEASRSGRGHPGGRQHCKFNYGKPVRVRRGSLAPGPNPGQAPAQHTRLSLPDRDLTAPAPLSQIKKMDMEARSVAPDRSRQLLNKVKEYKADLASLKDQLVKARSANSEYDATRAELVGVAGLADGPHHLSGRIHAGRSKGGAWEIVPQLATCRPFLKSPSALAALPASCCHPQPRTSWPPPPRLLPLALPHPCPYEDTAAPSPLRPRQGPGHGPRATPRRRLPRPAVLLLARNTCPCSHTPSSLGHRPPATSLLPIPHPSLLPLALKTPVPITTPLSPRPLHDAFHVFLAFHPYPLVPVTPRAWAWTIRNPTSPP